MNPDYPPGAENDSRSPWNQEDYIDCPSCKGSGDCGYCEDGQVSTSEAEYIKREMKSEFDEDNWRSDEDCFG